MTFFHVFANRTDQPRRTKSAKLGSDTRPTPDSQPLVVALDGGGHEGAPLGEDRRKVVDAGGQEGERDGLLGEGGCHPHIVPHDFNCKSTLCKFATTL